MENLYIGLLGSLLILDTTVAFQFLISQPLIACTLLGWFMGDARLGLQLGIYLQLLWLSSIPVGAAIIPEGNVAAIIITALVIRYNQNYANFNTVLICALLIGVMVSYIGGELVVLFRKFNHYFLKKVLSFARRGNLATLMLINNLALISHFLLMFVLIFMAMFLGDLIFNYVLKIPLEWDKYFKYTVMALIGLGAGLMLSMYKEKRHLSLVGIGLIVGCIFFLIK
jgi:mannose/fructose/N-acetylgalactosamine-specific phosphotransferase system component IIC